MLKMSIFISLPRIIAKFVNIGRAFDKEMFYHNIWVNIYLLIGINKKMLRETLKH